MAAAGTKRHRPKLAIRNRPAPTTTAPVARATRSPAGARRSTVMAAATTAIARRSVTPMTRSIAMRPTQHWAQWRPRRRPCRQAVPASAGSVRPRPDASRQLQAALTHATPAGELYIVVGLRRCDRAEYQKIFASLPRPNGDVEVARGCMISREPFRQLFSQIQDGQFDDYLSRPPW